MWREDGLVPIEGLLKGEQVFSRHEESFADAPQQITKTFGREAPDCYVLTTEFESIELTAEHPVWVQAKGWTRAAEVVAGDALATATGDALVIRNELVKEPLRVYNFSVAFTPSYFVGKSGVWVHNAGTCLTRGQLDLIAELQAAGVKVSPDKVVDIARDKSGRIVVLEEGNASAGLTHILARHETDFMNIGVPPDELPRVIIDAVADGLPVGKVGCDGVVYEITHNGEPMFVYEIYFDSWFIGTVKDEGAFLIKLIGAKYKT